MHKNISYLAKRKLEQNYLVRKLKQDKRMCSISRQLISDKFNSPLGDYKRRTKKIKIKIKRLANSSSAPITPSEYLMNAPIHVAEWDPWNRLLIQYRQVGNAVFRFQENAEFFFLHSFVYLFIFLHQSETMMNSRNARVTRFWTFDRVNWKYTIHPFHKFHTDIVTQSWWY
jgi:hypothetical protein